MLTKSRLLRALAHDNEDRGIEAGGADRVEIDLDEGLARVDMVTLSNKRMEALALKFNSVDSDMQHHLSRAVVGHDAQRVLSRKQRRDGARKQERTPFPLGEPRQRHRPRHGC